MLRYPRFERLTLGVKSDYQIGSNAPLAATQDGSGNLYVAEGIHRVSMFFNGLRTQIAGNYADRPLSPGTIGIVYPRAGVLFSSDTMTFDSLPNPIPMPKELADTQVLLNDRSAAVVLRLPGQINYFVPNDVASEGTAELQVVRKSTGEILAAGTVALARVSPALFVRGLTNRARLRQSTRMARSTLLGVRFRRVSSSRFMLPGSERFRMRLLKECRRPDQLRLRNRFEFSINTDFVPDENIQYFGLAPGFVGLYQINVKVPIDRVAPRLRDTGSHSGSQHEQ